MNIELLKKYNNLYDLNERKDLIKDMLVAFREGNKLTKKQVADYIGIKPQTYGAYESGRNETPVEVLVRLSILYDVPVDILIQRDNMAKNQVSAQKQIEFYNDQINELQAELLKNGNNEAMQMLLDGLGQINETMRGFLPQLPNDDE